MVAPVEALASQEAGGGDAPKFAQNSVPAVLECVAYFNLEISALVVVSRRLFVS